MSEGDKIEHGFNTAANVMTGIANLGGAMTGGLGNMLGGVLGGMFNL
jgi:phage-related protein